MKPTTDLATPRPWRFATHSKHFLVGGDGRQVVALSTSRPKEEAEANAALIVRAVNAIDGAAYALTKARGALNLVYGHHCHTDGQQEQISEALRCVVNILRELEEK